MPLLYTVAQPVRVHPPVVDPTDLAGEDISLRGGDTTITPSGSWATLTKRLAAQQSVEREGAASPGDFPRRPQWGMGLRDGLMRSASQDQRDRQAAAARRRLAVNPRVTNVRTVEVKQRTDKPNATVITIDADVSGQQQTLQVVVKPRGM